MTPSCATAWKAWAALAVALAVYAALQVAPLRHGGNANDFKHIYVGAVLLADGANPYDPRIMIEYGNVMAEEDPRFARGILPYVYLPFTGIVLRPLAWMPFRTAEMAWQWANHALLAAGLALAAAAAGLRFTWKTVALLGAAAAFNYTVFRQNNAGQLNMVLVFGSALLAFGVSRGWRPAALGFVAAFLMLFKLSPGIFLVWFALKALGKDEGGRMKDEESGSSSSNGATFPRGRAAAQDGPASKRSLHPSSLILHPFACCALWTAGWAAAMMLGCVAVAGMPTHLAFLPVLADMGFGKSTWAELGHAFWRDPYNQSFNAFFHHALVPREGFRNWVDAGPLVANGLTWAAALAVLGVFGWTTTRERKDEGGGMKDEESEAASSSSSSSSSPALPMAQAPAVPGGRVAVLPPACPAPLSSSFIPHPSSFPPSFALAILAALLFPSILWDHYLVQALVACVLLWPAAGRALRVAMVAAVAVWSLGVEFSGGFVHPGVLAALGVRFEVPLPGWDGMLQPVWMSLKLWPLAVVFAMASRARRGAETAEKSGS